MDKFWSVLGIIFLIGLVPGIYFLDIWQGGEALEELAVEYGHCPDSGCSETQKAAFTKLIIGRTGYTSEHQLRWCLGTDKLQDTRVRRGGWLKDLMVSAMRVFCPDAGE